MTTAITLLPFHFSLTQRIGYLQSLDFGFLPEDLLKTAARLLVYEQFDRKKGFYLNHVVTYGRVCGANSENGPLKEYYDKVYSHTGRWCWNSYMGEDNPTVDWTRTVFIPKQIQLALSLEQLILNGGNPDTLNPSNRTLRAVQSNLKGGYEPLTVRGKTYHPLMVKDIGKYHLLGPYPEYYDKHYEFALL